MVRIAMSLLPRRTILKAAAAAATLGAQTPKRPNLLFLFPDQLRHDFIEPSSSIPVRTPNIRKLVEQGYWFTRAVTPAPLCAPARACLASGKEYDNCGVVSNAVSYPLSQQTFYQLLRSAGYHVMGCG
jgi:arylsulfatase A-like enzyme